MIGKCSVCGNDYVKLRENHNCCSKNCASKLWYEANKKTKTPAPWFGECKNCGGKFESTRTGKNHQYFCSKDCRNKYATKQRKGKNKNIITHNCNTCGKEFVYEYRGHYRYYCDEKCRAKSSHRNHQLRIISSKKGIKSKCPMCGCIHYKEVNYIGTGTPRFFCYRCSVLKCNIEPEHISERTAAIC